MKYKIANAYFKVLIFKKSYVNACPFLLIHFKSL